MNIVSYIQNEYWMPCACISVSCFQSNHSFYHNGLVFFRLVPVLLNGMKYSDTDMMTMKVPLVISSDCSTLYLLSPYIPG